MKRLALVIAAVACASLLGTQARATVSWTVSGGYIYDHNGNPLPSDNTSTLLLVEDENGLGAPTATIPNSQALTPGSVVLSDYYVLGNWDMSASGSAGILARESFGPQALGAFGSGAPGNSAPATVRRSAPDK